MLHISEVKTLRGNICCHKHIFLSLAESIHWTRPFLLICNIYINCILQIRHWYTLTYLLTHSLHGGEFFLRSQLVFSQSNSTHFMEPEGSLPHSQVPATSSKYYPPINVWIFQVVSFTECLSKGRTEADCSIQRVLHTITEYGSKVQYFSCSQNQYLVKLPIKKC
jgi:hypothetical protein